MHTPGLPVCCSDGCGRGLISATVQWQVYRMGREVGQRPPFVPGFVEPHYLRHSFVSCDLCIHARANFWARSWTAPSTRPRPCKCTPLTNRSCVLFLLSLYRAEHTAYSKAAHMRAKTCDAHSLPEHTYYSEVILGPRNDPVSQTMRVLLRKTDGRVTGQTKKRAQTKSTGNLHARNTPQKLPAQPPWT
eukprot:scaffold103810_cov21-Tisochrysis_lutea.AAC.1